MSVAVWQYTVERLRSKLPEDQFGLLISPLQARVEGQVVTLLAPNPIIKKRLETTYAETIRDIFREYPEATTYELCIEVGSLNQPQVSAVKTVKTPKTGDAKLNLFNPNFTFERFVVSKQNQIAASACRQIAEHITEHGHCHFDYNPLFLYAYVGLGKSHLLQSIAQYIIKMKPQLKVVYVQAESFVSDMISSLQKNKMEAFKARYRQADILLIDDFQFFADKTRSQEEVFHTLNQLLDDQKQLVLSSDCYPKELKGFEARLQSRCSWGLIAGIDPPDLETRVAILLNKAELLGASMPHDVAFFIAECAQSNIRELEGALKRVVAYAKFVGDVIDIRLAKEALKDLLSVNARRITVENIIKLCAKHFSVRPAELISKSRSRALVYKRHIAMALAKECTHASLPKIGEAFGGRDHSTVIHACQNLDKIFTNDPAYKESYLELKRLISS